MEIWKAIPGYEELYEVSNFGEIRSLDRTVVTKAGWSKAIKGRTIRPFYHKGHKRFFIDICKNNIYERFSVHVIVLLAFHGPRPDGHVGCHNDGNSINNHAGNLRWDTHLNNIRDKERHGTQLRGSADPRSKITENNADEMRSRHKNGESQQSIANFFGVSRELVSQICRGKKWMHHAPHDPEGTAITG